MQKQKQVAMVAWPKIFSFPYLSNVFIIWCKALWKLTVKVKLE